MAKWSNAAVCKTAIRGFDSHSDLRAFCQSLLPLTEQKNTARPQSVAVDRQEA